MRIWIFFCYLWFLWEGCNCIKILENIYISHSFDCDKNMSIALLTTEFGFINIKEWSLQEWRVLAAKYVIAAS